MPPATTPSQLSYQGIIDLVDRWIREPIARRLSVSGWRVHPFPGVKETTTVDYSTLVLPDGAKIAYETLGNSHLGRTQPIVLICGMTSVRVDYERLTESLVKTHPVLLYDHRGIGNSTLTPVGDEELTIELMSRDLLALIHHLGWKEVVLCGFSMGGVIAQQMLLLPYHLSKPATISFRTTHVILAGTRSVVTEGAGLRIGASVPPSGERTPEEKKDIARRIVSSLVDPSWIESNNDRFEYIFKRATNPTLNRPSLTLVKQGLSLQKFDFANLLEKLPRDTQFLLVHGHLDQVIPFQCAGDTSKRIPWARFVEEGDRPGQVPSLDFGHLWYEYFGAQVWHDVIVKFTTTEPTTTRVGPWVGRDTPSV